MSPASRPPVPFSASPEGPPALAPCPGEAEEEATLRSRGGPGKVTSASLSTLRVPCWPVWQTFPPPPPRVTPSVRAESPLQRWFWCPNSETGCLAG